MKTTLQTRRSERGVALIMVLLIVTLLMILVVEFTYTVQVESHISRNSVNALQATYLARSGINILAGALMQDEDKQVDPGEKDPWRFFALGPCQNILSNLESHQELPANWDLCGRIVDESSKVNVNFTKPPQRAQGAQAPTDCEPNNPNATYLCWREVLAQLTTGGGADGVRLKEEIDLYWQTVQPVRLGQAAQATAPEFGSLEEVAARMPFVADRSVYDRLRPVATAFVVARQNQARLNINMVSPRVLESILTTMGSSADAQEIIARRQEAPFKNVGEAFAGQNVAGISRMFGTTSNLFRLEASAAVNGVAKTVRALVLREPAPPPRGAPPGTAGWRITYLDWQKESGAGAVRDAQAEGQDAGLEPDDTSDKDDN